MKILILLTISLLSFPIYSVDVLGVDSGHKPILLYKNNKTTSTALLIIGGIHGDEGETVQVVDYIRLNLESDISTYYIPTLNPTLYSIREKLKGNIIEIKGRRGYLREHLNSEGYLIPGSPIEEFNKKLFYRIFYGPKKAYINGIKHYVDPNRDFIDRVLPSTRVLLSFLNLLKERHNNIILVSFHGYMSGGRVYPEYSVEGSSIIIDKKAWDIVHEFASGSGYIKERIYPPAMPIIERFNGELIRYTGNQNKITGIDVEIDKSRDIDNSKSSLEGVIKLLSYINR